MEPIRGLVFDLDNTLIDRDGAARRVWVQLAADHDQDEAFVARCIDLDGGGQGDREPLFRWLSTVLPGSAEQHAKRFLTRLIAQVRPDDTTRAMLESLPTRLAVLTDGTDATQHAKLRAAGLADLFDVVVTSEQAGAPKPATIGFAAVLDQLGLDASACVHIGDRAERDVIGAQRAGLRSVWVSTDTWPAGKPPDWQVAHVTELRDALWG
jgi:putative hydrolase of the HAD superfamily